MYKMIVCDLDETLLDRKKQISDANRIAIMNAIKLGIAFVPATGRSYTSIDDILHTLQLYDKEDEFIIANNGGIIVKNKAFEPISSHFMPYRYVKAIVEFGFAKKLCVQVFTPTMIYAFQINEEQKRTLFQYKPDAVICESNDIDFLATMDIVKVMYEHYDVPYLQSLEKELNDEIIRHSTISYSSNRYMEFNSYGVDKGSALKELAQRKQIALTDILAIGDNHNDISMLKVAGTAAAVANAETAVKTICDYVSPYHHDDSAVADIIEHFIFKQANSVK